MTQIVQRTSNPGDPLLTLADNVSLTVEAAYASLDEPSYLFEYEASGIIIGITRLDLVDQSGISVCLIRSDLSDADLDAELSAFTMTKTTVGSGRYLEHQRLFAVAALEITDSLDPAGVNWHLHFKPKKRGGIPFNEGSGWQTVVINRTGTALTTGGIIKANLVMARFAFGGF